MRKLVRSFPLLLVLACTPTPQERVTAPVTGMPAKLIVGVTPYYSAELVVAENQALVHYLGRRVELPTELRIATSYAELSQLLQNNEVHVADLAPFAYIHAKEENPGIELLAIPIAGGTVSYPAQIITHDGTGIQSVADLRGKRFAFVDRHSASGYLYPLAYLLNSGYVPERFFSAVQFAGNHETLVDLIEFGRIDAGATFAMSSELARGKRLRVIANVGRIPLNAYAANAGLPSELVAKLRRAFLDLNRESDEGKAVLALTPTTGFASVHDEQYDEVRRVARLVREANLDPMLHPTLVPPPQHELH